jgi:hypothetical protein
VATNGVLGIDGSIFVVVIGPIVKGRGAIEELAVDQGNGNVVTINVLLQRFVASNCLSLGGKPKVFLFLDPNIGHDSLSDKVNLVHRIKILDSLVCERLIIAHFEGPLAVLK